MTRALRFLLAVPVAGPALAAHSGVPKVRTGPEASDVALFVVAALGIWLVRRAIRARFRKRGPRQD